MADEPSNSSTRASSPDPSIPAFLALDAVPLLDRSVSTPSASSTSTLSTRSRQSRQSDGSSTVVRRRGYMRPQGTAFADSARNRDSVMSLGSIAHMQYYFARTGLLDGKGGHLAKEDGRKDKRKGSMGGQKGGKENLEPAVVGGGSRDDLGLGSLSLWDGAFSYAMSDPGADGNVVESPTDSVGGAEIWTQTSEPQMLPPTVSTYKQKPSYTEPLPDTPVLRRELKEALQDACKVLEESQKPAANHDSSDDTNNDDGFHEIQGLHFLDIITLAIRAAKNYYTHHPSPAKLYALKSEKQIRSDLYQVLDILKRMASRNFRGGIKLLELGGIVGWIESIDALLKQEEAQEASETAERESWIWREGDWTGREHERERLFLTSFDPKHSSDPLPPWPEQAEDGEAPDSFLQALTDGTRLILLHNAVVARSQRRFGEIGTWHTDVAKPYRRAENLRYWLKAAELRWEIKLPAVSVSDVVNGKKDPAVWRTFDAAVLKWCQGVREELMVGWAEEEKVKMLPRRGRLPELRVEVPVECEGGGDRAEGEGGEV